MKIALVSFCPYWLQPLENIENCIQLVVSAHKHSCQLVIFPEMTLTGFSPRDGCLEPSVMEYCLKKLKEAAFQYNIYVIFGALSKFSSGFKDLPTNDAFVISPKAEIISRYSKIHLFSPSEENLFVQPGNKLSTFLIDGISFSSSICYDLRFPEVYSSVANGVNCFVNIASWPFKRADHWYALLKARAIENQAYMVGVNRQGIDGNCLEYKFSSIVYDPLGNPVPLEFPETQSCLAYVDIDFNFSRKIRSEFDVLNNKRHDLYKSFFLAS